MKIQLNNCQNEAQTLIAKSIEKLTSCECSNYLRVPVNDRMEHMAKILQSINNFVEQAKVAELSIDDILSANYHVKAAYDTFQDILNDIGLFYQSVMITIIL